MRKNCTLVLFDDDGNVIPNYITESPNDVIDSKNDVIESAEPSGDLISRADVMKIISAAFRGEIPYVIMRDLIEGLPAADTNK